MMSFYSLTFIVVLACAYFFYVAGEFEGTSGIAWSGLSILISIAIWRWLSGGLFLVLFGQFGLYAGITAFRARKKP